MQTRKYPQRLKFNPTTKPRCLCLSPEVRQSFSSQLQIIKRETKLSAQGKLSRSVKVIIVVYLVGVALIITGQSVYRYASQRISELEAKLSPDLSVYEYGMVKGSLDWWRPALISIYGPISICLITAGITVLVLLTAYTILRRK
jgi:hypothetical protein